MTSEEQAEVPRRFQRTLRLALVAPLVLAVILMAFLVVAIREIRIASAWVEHTTLVQAEVNLLQKLVVDLETGLRGFMLYKDPKFLEPYVRANDQIPELSENLKNLVADKPTQVQSLKKISVSLQAWKLRAENELATKSNPSLQEGDARKVDMDTIRNEFEAILAREEELKTERVAELNRIGAFSVVLGIGLIGSLLLLLSIFTRGWFRTTVKSYDGRATQLMIEREKLETILKSIGDAVLVVGPDSCIQFLNEIAEDLTQWNLSDAKGRPMSEVFKIINQQTRATAVNPVDQVLAKGIVVGLANHTVLIGKNGREVPIEDSAAPIRISKAHAIEGVVLVFRDVSEKHEAAEKIEKNQQRLIASEEQLHEVVEALKSANDAKSAFLANMSHEIRTPLGAILGFTDFLKDPELSSAKRINYVEIIERNGQQLHDIINDILDLSKVEAGQLRYEFRESDLRVLIEETVALLRIKAQEKNTRLEVDFSTDTPKVLTDPTRFKQILFNVIGNAIKFTDHGEIRIQLNVEPQDKDHVRAEIRVHDTGIGISEDQRSRLFKTFSQADISTTRKFGGSGLGLVLARTFAQGLEGDLTLEKSSLGKGSTFLIVVKLPLSQAPHALSRKPTQVPLPLDILQDLSILLAEDSPDNQYLIEKVLTDRGAKVELAVNGAEAIDKALRGRHDLILMDISMPIVDGYSATERLRESGYTKPIVALTAHAMAEIREKCLAVGFTDHLPKPIDTMRLYTVIARLTGRINSPAIET